MLVISRKKNETVLVNPGTPNQITIVVVEIRGDKVRFGLEAPKDVVIHRQEVYDAIKRNEERNGNAMGTQANQPMPKCPVCGTNRRVNRHGTEEFFCGGCRGIFDNQPDEGGTHSDRNPAARLERAERPKQRTRNYR